MVTPRFFLKDSAASSATLIYLVLNYSGKRLKLSTGLSVPPKYWNDKTELVKENREFPQYNKHNEGLIKKKKAVLDAFSFFQADGVIPEVEQLKSKFLELVEAPIKMNSASTFWDYFDEFIEFQKGQILMKSVMDYDQSLRKHLRATEDRFKIKLSFNALRSSGNFMDKFELYLNKYARNSEGGMGFSLNAKGKQMKNIKSFLNWCFMKEYCAPFSLKHIKKQSEDVVNIYLNEDEIDGIYSLEIEDQNLARIRDLFVFGCESGLRFSDFSRIKPEHVGEKFIELYQKKVKSKVKVPISPRMREILAKCDGKLPNFENRHLSNFNAKVREIGEKAGITETVVMQRKKGVESREVFVKKYDLISSHTCRRSYCTNKFYKGIQVKAIMAVSGHKTDKAFMKYLKISNEEMIELHYNALIA